MGSKSLNTTTESFQIKVLYASLPQRASKLPEVKDLEIQIYLIEMNFFGNFNFDLWQF